MKLVRDKIPALYKAGQLEPRPGAADYTFHKATPQEYALLLRLKLAEEVGEVLSAPDRESFHRELSDLEDVIQALRDLEGELRSDQTARRAKHARLGGFEEGWVLE